MITNTNGVNENGASAKNANFGIDRIGSVGSANVKRARRKNVGVGSANINSGWKKSANVLRKKSVSRKKRSDKLKRRNCVRRRGRARSKR